VGAGVGLRGEDAVDLGDGKGFAPEQDALSVQLIYDRLDALLPPFDTEVFAKIR
jgi:hypothetical protein